MPIAAPLLVPFAELVGITTAGLALSQISDAVQSYMKSNPEQSMKILTMLSPELGIASMMKKKTTKPKVEEEEVEKEPKLTAEEKREKFIELSKKRGRGRQDFIDLAQDLGLAKKGSEEQPPEDDEEEKILTGAQKTQLFKNLFREGGAKNIDYARLGRATKRGNEGLYQEGLEALKKTLKGKKDGGRIGLRYGGDTMGGPNDKSKSGPGPDDRGSPEQNRNQRDIVASGGATDNYYEKVDYVGDDTVFGPTQKYSGDGFLSGYRNLDPITGQPKMGLSYLADRIQGINPLGIMLGLINPALGLAYRGYNLVKDKIPETFETFKESDTLVDFYNNMKTPVVENVINKDIRDIRTPPTTQLFDPVKVQALIDKAKEEENLKEGGRVGYQTGGVATPEQYAKALQQVGAGSALDKLRSTGDYIKNYVSNVGQSVLNKNPAIRGIASFYGIGKPISSFSDFSSGSQQAIKDAVMRTVQNPTLNQYSKTNIPMSSYTNYFADKGKANTRGIYDTGYISRADQFKDMVSALAGNEDAIARMTLGRFNVNIDPTSGVGYLKDKYDFSKQMPGGKAYDINMQLPQDFVKQILNDPTYQKTTGYTPPTTQTTSSIPQFYQNNPGSYDFDKFKEAYAFATGQQNLVSRTPEGQIVTNFGNWDPSNTYSNYRSDRTSSSSTNPFFSQFTDPSVFNKNTLINMYGAPGTGKNYFADGGLATMFSEKR